MSTDERPAGSLDRAECMRLLATASVGRVAFTSGALPAVEPVRFVLDDDHIVFHSWDGPNVTRSSRGTVVAFQADAFGDDARDAWSVTVVGTAHLLDEAAARKYRAGGAFPVRVTSGNDAMVEVDVNLVSGRYLPAAA